MVEPGHVVNDAGANLGFFSVAAAIALGPAGHVLAAEPAAPLDGDQLGTPIWSPTGR
jgi:hypothetical protein